MKILHVVHGYPPAVGGTEHLVQQISEKIVARHKNVVDVFTTFGYNIDLFRNPKAPKIPAKKQEEREGVNIHRFEVRNRDTKLLKYALGGATLFRFPWINRLRRYYYGPRSRELKRSIIESDADVIMASSFPLLHMRYALDARKHGKPVVLLGALHVEDTLNYDTDVIYDAIRECDFYIANTDFEKNFLVEKGIDRNKIEVIGVGVDLDPSPETRRGRFRKTAGIPEQEILIAFVGQQAPHKGIFSLLQAFEMFLRQEKIGGYLVIAGAPAGFENAIRTNLKQIDDEIRNRIIWKGKVSEEEKRDILADCDIFASPSNRESFGITYVEAWSYRKPVIGCRISAVSSVIDEYIDGLLVGFDDAEELSRAISELARDRTFREKLGENGYKKVLEKYTWNTVADKYQAVYGTVMDNR